MVRFTLGLGKREISAGDIVRRGDVFDWGAARASSWRSPPAEPYALLAAVAALVGC